MKNAVSMEVNWKYPQKCPDSEGKGHGIVHIIASKLL